MQSLEDDKLTRDAEKMLQLLAEKAINRLQYVNEDDRKDCLQFALLDLLKYWRNFNPKFTNAFAYFTEIAKRGYAKGWNKLHPNKTKGTISISADCSTIGHMIHYQQIHFVKPYMHPCFSLFYIYQYILKVILIKDLGE